MNINCTLLIVLTVFLAILEITGTITIGWIWVLAPIWIPMALSALWFLFALVFILGAIFLQILLALFVVIAESYKQK